MTGPPSRSPSRSNDEWVTALRDRGESGARATRELQGYLERVSRRYGKTSLSASDLDDLVQESLTAIVQSLDSFRGDSRFTTWAAGILTRVAFTEIRRRRVREMTSFEEIAAELRADSIPSPASSPDELASKTDLLSTLQQSIAQVLTERQRTAVLAELRGLPTVEIAERLNIGTGALYKLVHDARKKLRAALLDAGYTADSIREVAEASS